MSLRANVVVVVVSSAVVVSLVVGASGCGLLNGVSDGDITSPLAGVFEGEGDSGDDDGDGDGEGEGVVVSGCTVDDECSDGGEVCDEASGECVGCVDSSDCAAPQVCVGTDCVDPGEGEGEGERCDVDDDCGGGQLCGRGGRCATELVGCDEGNPVDVGGTGTRLYVPEESVAAVAVLLHDALGQRWSGETICRLVASGYGVIDVDLADVILGPVDDGVPVVEAALDRAEGRFGSIAMENAVVVAASAATGFAAGVERTVPRMVWLSASTSYTGAPADVEARWGTTPILFLTIAGDNACDGDCVAEQDAYAARGVPDWSFGAFTGTGHGVDLSNEALPDTGGGEDSQTRIGTFLAATFQ